MTTLIWIESVLRPDGLFWYVPEGEWIGKPGFLLRTRLGGPDREILCDRAFNPVCESCRALMTRGSEEEALAHETATAAVIAAAADETELDEIGNHEWGI